MPIIAINSKPATKQLQAAYRPVFFSVSATANNGDQVPPVLYCDIYFNGTFYKTLAKSQYRYLNTTVSSEWEFDIQDAAQEYLKKFIGVINSSNIQIADGIALSAHCKFRSSGFDTNGFITTEGTAPIQATSGTPAVTGTGTQSTTFFIINATIQNEEALNFENNLTEYKYDEFSSDIFPLTHRPNPYKLCRGDNDFFPVFDKNAITLTKIKLNYRYTGQSTWRQMTANISPISGSALYIPNGPKNIASRFPGIDFNDVDEYTVKVLDANNIVQVTTTINQLSNACDDTVRIHFVNYDGAIDSINLKIKTTEHDTKSETYETPLRVGADRSLHSLNRFNIKSNDTYVVTTTDYNENQMDWLQQLFDSPAAWMELHDIYFEGDVYNPVVILDGKLIKRKEDDRFTYETELSFKFSQEKIPLRN